VLGLRRGEKALVREVWLQDGDKKLVFARSILPRGSLRGAWSGLGRLGARPLGAVLFGDQRVSRSVLRFRKISRNHPLYQRIGLSQGIWARHSIFVRDGYQILVMEAFLPAVLELPR
jgi:chorismate lyase